ncbi:hypothetical protein IF2G_04369 [Cordyceps javanica]|nr:hypothetical protein IF2G_04369 [Cordyceps javanica]
MGISAGIKLGPTLATFYLLQYNSSRSNNLSAPLVNPQCVRRSENLPLRSTSNIPLIPLRLLENI